jgi:hypothetical protein
MIAQKRGNNKSHQKRLKRHFMRMQASALPLSLPFEQLPSWVRRDQIAQRIHAELSPLPWLEFPERDTKRPYPGPKPSARQPYVAAFLLKIAEGLATLGHLSRFLHEHPALAYVLGFPLKRTHGNNYQVQIPDRRQLGRVLRSLQLEQAEFVLNASVWALRNELTPEAQVDFGDLVAGDTQAILAWVKENNPKEYVENRFDKTKKPRGDRNCGLGIKRRPKPKKTKDDQKKETPGPKGKVKSGEHLQIGADILWGYAVGTVASALPNGMEFVVAAHTRPFNESDISYFAPLMRKTEQVLGRKPRYGVWDTAYDAQEVYGYYHEAGGQAYVPLNPRLRGSDRTFSEEGHPLCAAGLAMKHAFVYWNNTSWRNAVQLDKYVCPLLKTEAGPKACPIQHKNAQKKGCTSTIGIGAGSRLRITIDRTSDEFKQTYRKRTMVERINSQAKSLGMTAPKLRSYRAIRNLNVLIYTVINLRVLRRLQQQTIS